MLQLLLITGTMVLMIAFVIYQAYKIRRLCEHGRQVVAMVTLIRHETGKTKWGFPRDNYYVTATWTNPRNGQTYTFWTWIMNRRPGFAKGSLVPVTIDPTNPQCYALEV